MAWITHFGDARDPEANVQQNWLTTHETTVQSCRGEHNHPPDVTANQVVATIGKMRMRAREGSTTIPQIYSEALQDLSQCGNKSIVAAKHVHLIFLVVKLLQRTMKAASPYATNTSRGHFSWWLSQYTWRWAIHSCRRSRWWNHSTWHPVQPSPSCRSWVSVSIPNLPTSLLSNLLNPHHKIWSDIPYGVCPPP